MYIICGLGNPGAKYVNTRHNVGFGMVDSLAIRYNMNMKKSKCRALIGEGTIAKERVILAKPQTFMNLSGESLKALAQYYKVPNDKIIVIYDDAALDIGKIRIRTSGSDGGHNGIKNIICQFGTEDISRIRVGIGGLPQGFKLENYVLSDFSKEDIQTLTGLAIEMPEIVEEIITNGIIKAMNKYN